MNDFTYRISLRIRHPHLDPSTISEKLSLIPRYEWKVGDKRRSPKGTPLKGPYRNTYWSYSLDLQKSSTLEEDLLAFVSSLKPHEDFFAELRSTGGSVECFVGWFSGTNSGAVFDHYLLAFLGDLKMDLSLDVYGQSEYTVEMIPEE